MYVVPLHEKKDEVPKMTRDTSGDLQPNIQIKTVSKKVCGSYIMFGEYV